MASPKEETNKPTGFTLKKFNRAKENRRGAKKRRRTHSSLNIKESDSDTSISDVVDDFDFDLDPPCSDIIAKKRSPDRKGKKRPRKKVLTSLSNAKHMVIPIPSFKMTITKKESNLSKRLSKLERDFFDEDDDDDEDNDENDNQSQPKNGDNVNQKTKSKTKGTYGVGRGKDTPQEITDSSKPTESVPKNIYFVERASLSTLPDDRPQGGEEANEQHPSEQQVEMVPESNSVSEPTEEILPQSPPRDNFAENDNEEGDDSNMVDFGGYDDDVDVENDENGDNGSELPSGKDEPNILNQVSTEKASIEPTDASGNGPQISFDLEREVDLLFEKSDPNTITMKLFCKELERRTGVLLRKPVKKKVKARVMALLQGEAVPTSTKTVGASEVEIAQEDPKSDAVSKENAVQEIQNEGIVANDRNGAGDDVVPEAMMPNVLETPCDVEPINEKNVSGKSSKELAPSAPHVRETIHQQDQLQNANSNVSNPLQEIQKSTSNEYCVEIETEKLVPPEVEMPTKSKKKNASKPKSNKPEKPKDAEPEKPTNAKKKNAEPEKPKDAEPDKPTKSKKDTTSKPKRQRKRKPKPSESSDTPLEAPKPAKASKPAAEKKPTQSRKRPRKAAACALCKTCPCQRANTGNDCENIATLDVKDFSRSDNAVERTLLRRLQKLEKSTESLAEQTETVRRRLKKHRRDVAKRRERLEGSADNAEKTTDSYFLPDAEVFEQQQGESQGLATGVVRKAQNRVFQTRQPTLFEMMGIPRDADQGKENGNGEANDDGINNGGERANAKGEKNFDITNDDDVPSVYVPEREFQEKIHRFEWKNSAIEATNETTGYDGGSIFDTVIPLTQDSHNDCDEVRPNVATTIPLWDDLFESSKKAREKSKADDNQAGLNDLLCLFDDEASDASDDKDRIDPNLLSQGAQTIAKDVIASAPSPEMLEGSYPNWKENIYFALKQKNPSELEQALENVQESRLRLQKEKEEMLRAWESKNAALKVFEKALQASFHRSKANPESSSTHNDE